MAAGGPEGRKVKARPAFYPANSHIDVGIIAEFRYWLAHVVRRRIRIFKNTCEPVRLSFAKTSSHPVDDGRCSRDRPSNARRL